MVEWITEKEPVHYETAVEKMEERVAGIHEGTAEEMVWLLEHPPIYTSGTSAKEEDLLDARFPVHETGRGGEHTYHGPGQRLAYVMLDLKKRQSKPDIKKFVWQLEEWVIKTLDAFEIKGERREGRVGIWVDMKDSGGAEGEEAKIAAIGVRVRHWVTYHGVSINLSPTLSDFDGIVPCGEDKFGVTSFHDLGAYASMGQLDEALQEMFDKVFND